MMVSAIVGILRGILPKDFLIIALGSPFNYQMPLAPAICLAIQHSDSVFLNRRAETLTPSVGSVDNPTTSHMNSRIESLGIIKTESEDSTLDNLATEAVLLLTDSERIHVQQFKAETLYPVIHSTLCAESFDSVYSWLGFIDGMEKQMKDLPLVRRLFQGWLQRKAAYKALREAYHAEMGDWPTKEPRWEEMLNQAGLHAVYLGKPDWKASKKVPNHWHEDVHS
jgi:hypothetical protein